MGNRDRGKIGREAQANLGRKKGSGVKKCKKSWGSAMIKDRKRKWHSKQPHSLQTEEKISREKMKVGMQGKPVLHNLGGSGWDSRGERNKWAQEKRCRSWKKKPRSPSCLIKNSCAYSLSNSLETGLREGGECKKGVKVGGVKHE